MCVGVAVLLCCVSVSLCVCACVVQPVPVATRSADDDEREELTGSLAELKKKLIKKRKVNEDMISSVRHDTRNERGAGACGGYMDGGMGMCTY